jgi:hypothetical protein
MADRKWRRGLDDLPPVARPRQSHARSLVIGSGPTCSPSSTPNPNDRHPRPGRIRFARRDSRRESHQIPALLESPRIRGRCNPPVLPSARSEPPKKKTRADDGGQWLPECRRPRNDYIELGEQLDFAPRDPPLNAPLARDGYEILLQCLQRPNPGGGTAVPRERPFPERRLNSSTLYSGSSPPASFCQ